MLKKLFFSLSAILLFLNVNLVFAFKLKERLSYTEVKSLLEGEKLLLSGHLLEFVPIEEPPRYEAFRKNLEILEEKKETLYRLIEIASTTDLSDETREAHRSLQQSYQNVANFAQLPPSQLIELCAIRDELKETKSHYSGYYYKVNLSSNFGIKQNTPIGCVFENFGYHFFAATEKPLLFRLRDVR